MLRNISVKWVNQNNSLVSLCVLPLKICFGDFLWPWTTFSVGIIFSSNLLFYWNVIQKYFPSFRWIWLCQSRQKTTELCDCRIVATVRLKWYVLKSMTDYLVTTFCKWLSELNLDCLLLWIVTVFVIKHPFRRKKKSFFSVSPSPPPWSSFLSQSPYPVFLPPYFSPLLFTFLIILPLSPQTLQWKFVCLLSMSIQMIDSNPGLVCE